MDYTRLKVVCDGAVATVTLCDPATRNALGPAMCSELAGALDQLSKGVPAARAVILTGEGRSFCSGANLEDAAALAGQGADLRQVVETYYNPIARLLHDLPMPSVAAVSGAAAGIGAAFALHCDIVVMGESASLAPAFAKVGLVPDGGMSWLLPRLVGKARAMEMALLGEAITAGQALDWGLVNRVVPDDQVLGTARSLARRLAEGPAALGATRRLILEGMGADLSAQLKMEARAQGEAGRTRDHKEGLQAFLQKRPPRFRGE